MTYYDLTGPQRALTDLISRVSRRIFRAGWLDGIEFSLWHAITTKSADSLWDDLTHMETRELKLLSTQCDGWVVWRDECGGKTFVSMPEWLEIYRKHNSQANP